MRPVRIITTFAFAAAAVAVTGYTARATVVHPSTPPAPAAAAPTARARPATPVTTSPPQTANPAPIAKPSPPTSAPRHQLYFATPQAAMRYLAAAYNRNQFDALKHVTTPTARANLVAMRPNAVNLRLVGCTANAGRGDYTCAFTHDYPAAMHQASHGHAHFTAAPADKVGWYMTVLNDCS